MLVVAQHDLRPAHQTAGRDLDLDHDLASGLRPSPPASIATCTQQREPQLRVGGVRKSRDAAFERYVQQRGAAWERYAFVLTGDAFRAEDLVQQALMKVYRHWTRITGDDRADGEHASDTTGLDAYVRRVMTNAYLDWHRRRSNTERPMLIAADPQSSEADPGDQVATADEVTRALAQLSRQQRTVLVLRHYQGYDDAAIAATLGCSESTVRSHASRGLQRLRDELTPAGLPGRPSRQQEQR